ncbi:MAG TPA: hypothetical protein VGA01_08660, partial [Candidatus Binatia bacterium]
MSKASFSQRRKVLQGYFGISAWSELAQRFFYFLQRAQNKIGGEDQTSSFKTSPRTLKDGR